MIIFINRLQMNFGIKTKTTKSTDEDLVLSVDRYKIYYKSFGYCSSYKKIALLLAIIIFLVSAPLSAQAQGVYYVRADASGANNGSDWNNAFKSLPTTLVRGATYYIASGKYSGYTFKDPLAGEQYITIKKAIKTDHLTDVGWQDSYGEGPAVFEDSQIRFSTGYYIFDGQVGGGPGNWKTGHGFKFTSPAGRGISYVVIDVNVSNIKIRHSCFTQVGDTTQYTVFGNAIYNSSVFNNSTIEYCYMDNLGGLPFFFRGGTGNIIQFNYTGDICGASVRDPNQHCEALVIGTMSDLHFRWNYIAECPSSGGFVKNDANISNSVKIYGNIFKSGFPINCNSGTCTDWRIINNTFHAGTGGPFGGDGIVSGLLYYNNLSHNFSSLGFLRGGKYNFFSNVGEIRCDSNPDPSVNIVKRYPNDCDTCIEIRDPFINSSGNIPEDFMLAVPIEGWAGIDVCQFETCTGENKYNVDLIGRTRGIDNIWDRGALEYVSGTTRPSPPSGVRLSQANL